MSPVAQWEAVDAEGRPVLAMSLAYEAFGDLVDKVGHPKVLHSLRVGVALAFYAQQPTLAAAGFLHDVVEDTAMTLATLRKRGVPLPVLELVEILTHRRGERYFDYIARVAQSPGAATVKWVDLTDNMRRSVELPPPVAVSLVGRWQRAQRVLAAAWPHLETFISDGAGGGRHG